MENWLSLLIFKHFFFVIVMRRSSRRYPCEIDEFLSSRHLSSRQVTDIAMRNLKILVVFKRLTNSYLVVKCPTCINKIKCLVCSGVHSGGVRTQVLAFALNSLVLYHQGPSSGTVDRICAFRGRFLWDVRTTGRPLSFTSYVVSFYCNAGSQQRVFLRGAFVDSCALVFAWDVETFCLVAGRCGFLANDTLLSQCLSPLGSQLLEVWLALSTEEKRSLSRG